MKAVDDLAAASGAGSAPVAAFSQIRLRRDGLRPLCFSGCLIARHDGRVHGSMLWHDLALYRIEPKGYAIEIVARLSLAPDAAQSRAARCHAVLAETLDDALTRIEGHDASADLCPGLSAPRSGFDDSTMSPAMQAIQATILHGFCMDVVHRYSVGVGSFLHRICLTGV